MTLKPFDLEAALAGAKVVTMDGQEVIQLTYFKDVRKCFSPLRGVVNGVVQSWHSDGKYCTGIESDGDLFLAPKLREGWINIYTHGNAVWYPTKEKADLYAAEIRIACVRIEWEE